MVDYTSKYQLTLNKVVSLISEGSHMHMKTIEMILQANILRNLGSEYSVLVSAIQTEWREQNTNLANTIFRAIWYEQFIKETVRDKKNLEAKVLSTGVYRAPKGTWTTPECVERGLTSQYNDRYRVKTPESPAKYTLREMKPQGLNQNLRKATATAQPADPTQSRYRGG